MREKAREMAGRRLWANIFKAQDGCWFYQPRQGKLGAKSVFIYLNKKGYNFDVHKLAFDITYGLKVPLGCTVKHTCDHPTCCNPAHLYVEEEVRVLRELYPSLQMVYSEKPAPKVEVGPSQAKQRLTQACELILDIL